VTVEVNSLDRSPLGAFVRSPLGAFNGSIAEPGIFGVVGMVWLTESRDKGEDAPGYIGNQALYDSDLEEYHARKLAYHTMVPPIVVSKGLIIHVLDPSLEHSPIGAVPPAFFTEVAAPRSPSFEFTRQAFLAVLRTASPPTIGPMTIIRDLFFTLPQELIIPNRPLEPGFSQFFDWLRAQRGTMLVPGITLPMDATIEWRNAFGEGWRWLDWILPAP